MVDGGDGLRCDVLFPAGPAMHKSPDSNEIQGKSPHYSYVSPQKGLLYTGYWVGRQAG